MCRKKLDDIVNLGKIGFAFNFQFVAQVRADAQEKGLVTLGPQVIQGDILPHGDAGADFHAQGRDESLLWRTTSRARR